MTTGTQGLKNTLAQQAEGPPEPTLAQWLAGMERELARALPAGGLTAARLARIVLTEVRRTPKLASCTRESFAGAIMTCAQLGLEPGNATGEAYLIPYGRVATVVIGYQGMVKLYWQHPLARTLDAQTVYARDEFDYSYGLEPTLVHKPARGDRGEAVAYYAVATFTTGGSAFVVMYPDDIEKIRARSKAKDDGPWQTDYDAMAKKTCVRQLFKTLPKSRELARAIAQDEQVRTDTNLAAIDVVPTRVEDTPGTPLPSDTPTPATEADPAMDDEPPLCQTCAGTGAVDGGEVCATCEGTGRT